MLPEWALMLAIINDDGVGGCCALYILYSLFLYGELPTYLLGIRVEDETNSPGSLTVHQLVATK